MVLGYIQVFWNTVNVIKQFCFSHPAFMCSNLTIEAPEHCVKFSNLAIKTTKRAIFVVGFFIINFEQILHIDLVFPLLTLTN